MISGQMPKLLILSGDLGDGHKQAANALQEAARQHCPGMEVEIVDFMEWAHPKLHHVGRYCYTQWVTKFPSMYGYLFRKTRGDNPVSSLFKKIKLYTFERLAKLIREIEPTIIVSTFPPAAAGISLFKAQGLTDLPTVTVITDHTDHSYWLHPNTNLYIVGSEHVKQALVRQQIEESRIAVTGIPILPRFDVPFDKKALREKYGLDPEAPVVLMMGGGLGMIAKECSSLLLKGDMLESVQWIVVCGHNDKLKQQLEADLADVRSRVMLTGYVTNVPEFMALSDLLITKPGGLTTSEAVALELPMLLYKPLPGQEQDNCEFLMRSGVAMKADDETELRSELERSLNEPELLASLRKQAGKLKHKDSALQALTAILETETRSTFRPTEKIARALYARA